MKLKKKLNSRQKEKRYEVLDLYKFGVGGPVV